MAAKPHKHIRNFKHEEYKIIVIIIINDDKINKHSFWAIKKKREKSETTTEY